MRGRRGAVLALSVVLAGCSAFGQASSPSTASDPPATAVNAYARTVISPPDGPVKPFRGEMEQEVRVVDGYASMLIRLRNVGTEPVSFLNTLYDYEPQQLYTPLVRVGWSDGAPAFGTRAGRFFPSPAVVPAGEEAVYLMAGQQVHGAGDIGEVTTHIKFCPTRGMDDVPADVLVVSGLQWRFADGVMSVSGKLAERRGDRRATPPTIGVAFFDDAGTFVGGVVEPHVGDRLEPNEERAFEISGPGVDGGSVATAIGWAWVQ